MKAMVKLGLTGLAAAMLATGAASAQRTSILERYADWDDFSDRRSSFISSGYRVADLDLCREPDGSRFWLVAVFVDDPRSTNTYANHRSQSWSDFGREVTRQYNAGMRLVDFDASPVPGGALYSAVYEQGSGGQYLFRRNSWDDFVEAWRGFREDGMRLIDVDEAIINGDRRYFGVVRRGNHREALYRYTSWDAFVDRWRSMTGDGWRLVDLAVSQRDGGSAGFSGVFNRGSRGHALYSYNNWADFMQRWLTIDRNGATDVELQDVECWSDGDRLRYAGVWRTPSGPRRAN